ncbi:MAG: formyltransferase family protein, partial [bacterium]
PFYTKRFFSEFLRLLADYPIRLLEIVSVRPFNTPSNWVLARQMMRFYGPRDFGRMALRYLWKRLREPNLRTLATQQGAAFFPAQDINSDEFLTHLAKMEPDVIVSVAAPQIFRKRLLRLPRLGCWNIHGGYLPRYRGMMPAFWTLLHGEKEGAITIHKMNSRLDDGEILLQKTYPILPGESLDHLIRRSKTLGARILLDALEMLHHGDHELLPNDRAQATYFSFPASDDVRRYRNKGLKLV